MPIYKNLIKTALLICIGLFSHIGLAQDKSLSWCAYYNWAPWIYPVADGYDGILIEQLALFEKQHKIKAQAIERQNWKRCQVDVINGNIDMILGANQTAERKKVMNYLEKPAFINRSTVSAYALQDNKWATAVEHIEQLKNYNLAINRGNSFGKVIDGFIASLEENKRTRLNTLADVFKMILAGRKDYVFSTEASFQPALNKHMEMFPKLRDAKFKKIYTLKRQVPVYMAFTKKGNVYRDMNQLWLKTLKSYEASTNIQERIIYHTANADNAASLKN